MPLYYSEDDGQQSLSNSLKKPFNVTKKVAHVGVINMPAFLSQHVLQRNVPSDVPGPRSVIMKLDVEGEELHILPILVQTRALCNVNLTFVEFHGKKFHTVPERLRYTEAMQKTMRQFEVHRRGSVCTGNIITLDDETYWRDDGEYRPRITSKRGAFTPFPVAN